MISFFPILTSLLVIALSIKLLYSYAAKRTSCFIHFLTFFSWVLSFGILAILPYDVYLSLSSGASTSMTDSWKVVYWAVFILCWVGLPLTQYYDQAGDFTFCARCCSALLQHAWVTALMGVAGAIFIMYLALAQNMDQSKIYVFLIVISNTWGLFLAMTLLGYGLVEVPRAFWRKGNLKAYRNYYHYQSSVLSGQKRAAELHLREIVTKICAAASSVSVHKDHYILIQILISQIPLEILTDVKSKREHESRELLEKMKNVTKRKLVKLNKGLKLALAEHTRCVARWTSLCYKAFRHDDILHNRRNGRMQINSPLWKLPTGMCGRTRSTLEWLWYTQLKPVTCRLLAIGFAAMSVVVVLGEGTLYLDDSPVALFPKLFTSEHGDLQTQLLVCVPLFYIAFCAYYALFSLRMTGFYGIYSHNQTDPANLLWCASVLCQLIAPMSYNFLKFINVTGTAFDGVMGVINFVPVFGSEFTTYFPLTLVVFFGLNTLQVYSRVLTVLGLARFRFSESYEDDALEEGKELLRFARIEREKALSSAQEDLTVVASEADQQFLPENH